MRHFEPAKPGTKLAGFNVLAEIGRGAASIIYLVQDAKTKQIWALKHVERHSAKDQRFLDQAISEYEVANKVRHPNVRGIERLIRSRARLVTVKEVFLLMEYVDGLSIELHPPSTFEDVIRIFRQVAEGLDHMHKCGYVHADMKPNNIVINEDGSVKVIDLGQTCPVGTIKERIQGTPDYIAPEQVHRREITAQTDVFNFGATLYWVLTKQNIPTAMPKGDSLLNRIDDHLIAKATPPHEINKRVPVELSDLVMHCIETEPARRPANMEEVIVELDDVAEILKEHGDALKSPDGPETESGAA